MNVTNNMPIKSYISIRKSIFPPKYPSPFPSHRHNIHIHTYALVHSYLSWMTSFFEPLMFHSTHTAEIEVIVLSVHFS